MTSQALCLDELCARMRRIKDGERRAWSCLVIGRMGTGKTRLLDLLAQNLRLNTEPSLAEIQSRLQAQSDLALISVLPGTPEQRVSLLSSSGLNTVPSWLTPTRHLSGGEFARVVTALQLSRGVQVIDNFGNCLDEQSANMAALAAQRLLPSDKPVIFATQSPQLARFLQPDYIVWIADPTAGALASGCRR